MAADGFDDAPLDRLTRSAGPDPMVLAGALAAAAAAIARLDQALASHPLAQAFLYRTRLESVRRQAAVDGQLIDPWHRRNHRGSAPADGPLLTHHRPRRDPGPGPRGPHPAPVDR